MTLPTEEQIAKVIREVEQGGRHIHGMMPEAAARAILELFAEPQMAEAPELSSGCCRVCGYAQPCKCSTLTGGMGGTAT